MKGYLLTVLLLQQDSGYHFVYCFKDDISIGFLPAFEDVYAFNLNYFAGDYAAISGAIAFPGHSAYMPNPADNRPLYNGNISSMATASVNFPGATAGKQPQLCNYSYDQLNRITGMDVYRCTTLNNNSWSGMVATGDFKERMAYDANGNIVKYLRQGFGSNLPMDSLSYNYTYNSGKLVNNKLNYVTDQINGSTAHSTNYTDDIEDQAAGNYVYDPIGNLTADTKEGVTNITWNVYGKIKQVQRTATAANPVTNIKYTYDAGGNRISKQVTKSAADSVEYTWYVRDASGNIMTTYFAKGAPNGTIASTTASLLLTGQTMYGSSRLGVLNRNVDVKPLFTNGNLVNFTRGNKFFELTNHLGNVMETISDKKTGVTTNGTSIDYYYSEVITANDYYSFGSQMPGRQYKLNANSYRYGFNGQENDNEISGDGNAYSFDARMYNPRIGRWFSADAKGKAFSSPYNYVQNNPINRVDPDGNDDIYFVFLYDKTIPSLSHLTKFSVIVRNNEPNRYIHRTYFLTSGKGGITDQVLSAPKDKEFYPANWSSSSGLTSTKVFGFLNADDKDFVTLGKYMDEFPDIKREANYQEIRTAGSAPSQRAKNSAFLASALNNNEKRKEDAANEAAGMSLVKGVVGWAAGELVLAEIIDAVVVSKIVNSANNAVKGLKYENIGTATYKQTMAAGRKFAGEDATVILAKDGTIESLESANGLKQFRAPRFKGGHGRVQANFETRPSTDVNFSRPTNNTTNAHLDEKN